MNKSIPHPPTSTSTSKYPQSKPIAGPQIKARHSGVLTTFPSTSAFINHLPLHPLRSTPTPLGVSPQIQPRSDQRNSKKPYWITYSSNNRYEGTTLLALTAFSGVHSLYGENTHTLKHTPKGGWSPSLRPFPGVFTPGPLSWHTHVATLSEDLCLVLQTRPDTVPWHPPHTTPHTCHACPPPRTVPLSLGHFLADPTNSPLGLPRSLALSIKLISRVLRFEVEY